MAVHVQTKDDNWRFSLAKFETFGNLVWLYIQIISSNNNKKNHNFISRGYHLCHVCKSNIWSSFTKVGMSLTIEQT